MLLNELSFETFLGKVAHPLEVGKVAHLLEVGKVALPLEEEVGDALPLEEGVGDALPLEEVVVASLLIYLVLEVFLPQEVAIPIHHHFHSFWSNHHSWQLP